MRRSPPIEKWVKHREDFHLRYRPTGKNVRDVVLWGVAFPVFVYYLTVYQQARVWREPGGSERRGAARGPSSHPEPAPPHLVLPPAASQKEVDRLNGRPNTKYMG